MFLTHTIDRENSPFLIDSLTIALVQNRILLTLFSVKKKSCFGPQWFRCDYGTGVHMFKEYVPGTISAINFA